MVSFARVPPRRRRSPDGSDGCASLAFSMPLGLVSGLISGRPGPPFSRAISSRSAATSRRSSAPSSKSFNTKLLSSAGESASMSGGDIPPSSQKTDDSGILPSPHESIRRTYRPTPSQRSPGLLPLLRTPFTITDTVANITANLDAIAADASNISSVTASNGSISVSAATFLADQAGLDLVNGGFAILDSATNLEATIDQLADAHVTDIVDLSDVPLVLTAAQVKNDQSILAKIVDPDGSA